MNAMHRAVVAAVASLALPAIAADAVAFITNLRGEVTVDGNARPLLLAELAKGQKITLARDGALCVMYIATGKEYILKGPGDFHVKDTGIAGSSPMPPPVRATEWRTSEKVLVQVAQSSAASVRMRSIGKPKEAAVMPLLYPVEGKVATLQPTFRWRAADPGQAGEISVQEIGREKPVHTAKAIGGSYRLPTKLKPDGEYAWSYAIGGSEVGSGRFRTVSSAALEQIEKHRPSDKAEFSDRVLFALMLQEMGAIQDAREAWAKLAQERSDLPELAALAR